MKLQIPFVKNPGWECGQACSAMMIKYFNSDFDHNIAEFDKVIHHATTRTYTFPLENAILLDHFDIRATCFSSVDYKTTLEEPDIFQHWFGKDYDTQKQFINEEEYNWMVQEGKKRGLFEKRKTSLDDMIQLLLQGYVVALALDSNTLRNTPGSYQGHFVILSGITNENTLLLHNPDEGPHIEYSKSQIEKAYRHPIIADDCWVAFGKKQTIL